ncbi:MAG: GNAT family N-acetyltransferase [Kofleriaceae bacterium]|nr:GNAT family N-acetyltransferase [Kofleriaceae bacterium]MCL4224884.1 GNAT family N-acetyltransferase [Myxococcales bacterium]
MIAQRLEITSARLRMVLYGPEQAWSLCDHVVRNDVHLARWSPPHPEGYLTEAYWEARGKRNLDDAEAGRAFRFAIRWRDEPHGPVLGLLSLTDVARGAQQWANLGYGLDEREQGKGIMTEAVRAACAWAFTEQRLHRISASYMPGNERSGRVLRRAGFSVYGYARDYLFINGAWRDHLLAALVDPRELDPEGRGV